MVASRSLFRGIASVASCGALLAVIALPQRQARIAQAAVEQYADARWDASESRGPERSLQKQLLRFEQDWLTRDLMRALEARQHLHPTGDFSPPGPVRLD